MLGFIEGTLLCIMVLCKNSCPHYAVLGSIIVEPLGTKLEFPWSHMQNQIHIRSYPVNDLSMTYHGVVSHHPHQIYSQADSKYYLFMIFREFFCKGVSIIQLIVPMCWIRALDTINWTWYGKSFDIL